MASGLDVLLTLAFTILALIAYRVLVVRFLPKGSYRIGKRIIFAAQRGLISAGSLIISIIGLSVLFLQLVPITGLITILSAINVPATIEDEAGLFGIYALLALSLNLEYGYCGVPNFGKVFFVGLGGFMTGSLMAHTLSWISLRSLDICSANSTYDRLNFAPTVPLVLAGLFISTIIASAAISGVFGYVLAYPALRLREDYLGILLIAVGEVLRIFLVGFPANIIGCEYDSIGAIPNPFIWLYNYHLQFAPPFDWVTPSILVNGLLAIVILASVAIGYIIVSRLGNSPYGRMMKSIRDDEQASLSLGKNPAKVRGRVMVIGSALAGVAGALLVIRLGSASTDSFITYLTFITWAIVLLGGAANNRGVVLGAFVFVTLDLLTLIARSTAAQLYPSFDILLSRASVDVYAQTTIVGVLVILIILYRPLGILREKPIKTPAWEVLKRDTDTGGKPAK